MTQCQNQLSQIMEMYYIKEHNLLCKKTDRLNQIYTNYIEKQKNKFHLSLTRLDDLSPLKIMNRGYSLVKKANKIVKSIHQIQTGDIVELMFEDGKKDAQIK